ncbi:MAG: tRNA (N6-threonylcarbamoyladenosine(37)-N6)-methyltransferase TrmO [Candidatus Asgardarchaeia archaeon]
MKENKFLVYAIGHIEAHKEKTTIIRIKERFFDACSGLEEGSKIILLCWFHLSDSKDKRSVLKVHPRGDLTAPLKGIFATRSPIRPNPIGHYTVKISKIKLPLIEINKIDAVKGTPIIDIRPFIPHLDCPTD